MRLVTLDRNTAITLTSVVALLGLAISTTAVVVSAGSRVKALEDWRTQAEKTLDGIATESIERAKAALAAADIKEVERFTGIAFSANDRRAEPFAIRASIRRRQGNKAGEAVMAKLAARAIGEADFAVLVDRYCRSRR